MSPLLITVTWTSITMTCYATVHDYVISVHYSVTSNSLADVIVATQYIPELCSESSLVVAIG
jgi:hypothetical protein